MMNRRQLHRTLLKYLIIACVAFIGLLAIGTHPLLASTLAYAAIAGYHWIGLGPIIARDPEHHPGGWWTRITMSALWPITYLYAASGTE